MSLSAEDLRFAINDARERQRATVDLIGKIDQQALSLLQLYVTLAGAALTGAGAVLLSAQPTYPPALGIGLIAFSVPIIVGAVFCVVTIWPGRVSLPGRDPDFWLWANGDSVGAEIAYVAYLKQLEPKNQINIALNKRVSNWMLAAKISGIAAPLIGFLVGAIASQPI